MLVALNLVERKLPHVVKGQSDTTSTWDRFKRIDIAGVITMSLSIAFALIVLDLGGQKFPWKHPLIISAIAISGTSGIAFILIEKFLTKEPIFPLRLITEYSVANSYLLVGLATLTQTAV